MIYDSWREKERGNLVEVEVNLILGMISYDKEYDDDEDDNNDDDDNDEDDDDDVDDDDDDDDDNEDDDNDDNDDDVRKIGLHSNYNYTIK